ncbi:MAG: DUF167 domain-containing protein [Nitrospirae bacterium]|nr:DUF167 domain-containing protein [Nitrospirota bacterium]
MKISVAIKPKSRVEKVEKTNSGYIVHVKEQPIENKANTALIKALAGYFDVPKSRVEIVSGIKSKQKIVEIRE